uniref:Uncharacterized protein n=1 Tax=Peronospora matthiolae TaxID=2874970 RepID=A0AAV1UN58_9STRA
MTWGESIARTVRGWFVKADKEPTETDQYIAGMTDEGVMVKGRIVNMDVFVEFLESFFTEPARYDYRKLVTSLLGMDDGSSPRVMPGDLATALNLLRDRPDMEIHAIGLEKALPEVLSSSFQNKVYSLLLKHRVSPEKVMGLLLRVVRATSFGSHRGHTKQLSEEASIRMLGPLYRYIELYRAKYGPERISGTSDKELMAYFFKKAESHGVTFKWKLGGRRA